MKRKREHAAKMLYDATIYLMNYGHRDASVNVARELIMDAERRVRNGFGPVPSQDADNLLEIENRYLNLR